MALQYRTRLDRNGDWTAWKTLSVPNELAFSSWYTPRNFQFRETEEPEESEPSIYPHYADIDPRHLRGVIRHLEERVSKLERLRYVATPDGKCST